MNRVLYGMGVLAMVFASQARNPVQHDPSDSRHSNGSGPPYDHRIAALGVPNLFEVTPMLYRGGQPTAVGLQTLAQLGIRIVVDGREFDRHERDEVIRLGMQYVAIS